MHALNKLRDRIDWLDTQIATLLSERMQAVDQVGRIKQNEELEVDDPSRELFVLSQVKLLVKHPILKEHIVHLYKEILRESKVSQEFAKNCHLPFEKIGVIGMGLIGGSICKCLKIKKETLSIETLDYPSADLKTAVQEGWVHTIHKTIEDLLASVDLLILAAPLSQVFSLAQDICRALPKGKKLWVLDVASVKEEVTNLFEKLSSSAVEFISSHPMAGKEKYGFTHSEASLFAGRPWIMVPHKNNRSETLQAIEGLLLFFGAHPIYLSAKEHDEKAALISHLPSFLAKSYVDFVNMVHPESMKMAGPGFDAFTRLSQDNEALRKEMGIYNKQNIDTYLKAWINFIQQGIL